MFVLILFKEITIKMLKNILVTGGEGRFAKELQKTKSSYNFFRNKTTEYPFIRIN